MKPIKLLHTADIHIGMENYGRVDPETGINARVMDFLRRLSDIGDYAIEQRVDVFVFAGDAYRTREPNPTHQREFARRIKRIADAGIPVILLVGNHDLPAVQKRATSISIFDTLDVLNVTVCNDYQLVPIVCRQDQRLNVATVPYPLRQDHISREESEGKSLADIEQLLSKRLEERVKALAAEAKEQPEIPAILVGHFSVKEASQGSEQNIMVGRDVTIDRSSGLADPAWRYVALGHIHKHQSLNRDLQPPIIYSGSIERIDFGEEHEPKGFVVAEISDGPTTWQFLPGYRRQARPFLTIGADVRDATDPTAAVLEAIAQRGDLRDSVVRVMVKLRQEQEALLREREIGHALEEAYFVAAFQRDVERAVRPPFDGVPIEAMTPMQLLKHYLEGKGISPEHTKKLLDHAQALMQREGTN
jgi:exonuclease SbcD